MNSINSLTRHLVGSASPDKSNRNDHTLDHYVKRAKSLKSKSKKGSLSSDSGSVTSRSPSPEPWSSAGKPRTPVFRGKKRSQSPQPTSTGKRTKRDSSPFDIPIYEQQGIGVNVSFVAPDHISIHDKGYRDWTQEEVDLLNRLNDRGGAPFIPPSWAIDFETLPTNNFTVDGETAFFRALNIEETGEFRGTFNPILNSVFAH